MKTCELCQKEFQPARYREAKQRFCSPSCVCAHMVNRHQEAAQQRRVAGHGPTNQKPLSKQCEECGGAFTVSAFFYPRRRFCSRDCWRKNSTGSQNPAWKGGTGWYKKQRKSACERCGSRTGRLVVHHRDEDRANNAPENLETLCTPCHRRHHWQTKRMREQGVTAPEQLVKHRNARRTEGKRYPYKMWRKAVLERDGHTCQECGRQAGRLDVHHVQPWKTAPELRYAVENGITLCFACHEAKHP